MKSFIRFFIISSCFLSCNIITAPAGYDNWHLKYENRDDLTYYAIHFTDENNGWIVGYAGAIKKTSTGGSTWVAQQSNVTANLWDISFIDHDIGWICGADNTVLKTINSGKTWNKILIPGNSDKVNVAIQFINENIGWCSTNNGEILKSVDGGITWQVVRQNNIGGARLVVFDENTTYFLSGKLYRTFDGSVTWDSSSIAMPTKYRISNMFFTDPLNGYFVTENGTGGTLINEYPVIMTKNGGSDYYSSDYLNDDGFRCLYFVDQNNGWIAGNNIYKTVNGGKSWQLDYYLITGTLGAKDLSFINKNCGWLINWDGQIYKYESDFY